jgi:hypothetical protein
VVVYPSFNEEVCVKWGDIEAEAYYKRIEEAKKRKEEEEAEYYK